MLHLPILALCVLAAMASTASGETRCEVAIAQFRAVIDNDERTGNLNEAVYRRMGPELRQVSAECASGREAEAIRALAAVKHRHGYH